MGTGDGGRSTSVGGFVLRCEDIQLDAQYRILCVSMQRSGRPLMYGCDNEHMVFIG